MSNFSSLFDVAQYNPVSMMTVFQNTDGEKYLEAYTINEDGTVGTGHPVSKSFIKNLCENFSKETHMVPHGVLPSNMLLADTRAGQEHYIWWNKPQKRKLYFIKDLNMEEGDYNMPAVIYEVKDGKSLYVYAFDYKRKGPSGKTRLIHGPFFNYYEDGRVCLGNSKTSYPDNPSWKDLQDYWEKMFWRSINSHLICKPTTKPLVSLLKKAMDAPFETAYCKPFKFTLEKILW